MFEMVPGKFQQRNYGIPFSDMDLIENLWNNLIQPASKFYNYVT